MQNAKSIWSKWKRTPIGQRIALTIIFIVFVVYSLTLLYPFLWAIINSLKINREFFSSPFALPTDWIFSNWADAFTEIKVYGSSALVQTNFIEMFFNSIWFSLGASVLSVAVSTMTAYVVSKYEFRGRSFIYSVAIFIMIIPIVGSLPATYKLYSQIGIRNSPLLLIVYTGGFGFNFVILYGFFKNVSWSYAEAAFIDGANNLKVFLYIMIPQAIPCITSLFIIQLIGVWNDYMTPLLYLPDYATLSTGIYVFGQRMTNQSNYPVYFAGILLSTIPILVCFACFSETIMSNTVAGGLKG